jgi:hypothetical protein
MRYLLVNDRVPKPPSYCALCCDVIGGSYVRDVGTRLSYCCVTHYTDHSNVVVLAVQLKARVS